VGKSAIPAAVAAPAAPFLSGPSPDGGADLLGLLAGVPDGRTGQGRDHPVAAVLALAAAAVVAGMKGYTAISGWVADVPPPVLAGLTSAAGQAPPCRRRRPRSGG
jgi:DDE_Tnp_1-associated